MYTGESDVVGYSDASEDECEETRRFTAAVICIYANGTISWLSQRRNLVAISITGAKIIAASEASFNLNLNI